MIESFPRKTKNRFWNCVSKREHQQSRCSRLLLVFCIPGRFPHPCWDWKRLQTLTGSRRRLCGTNDGMKISLSPQKKSSMAACRQAIRMECESVRAAANFRNLRAQKQLLPGLDDMPECGTQEFRRIQEDKDEKLDVPFRAQAAKHSVPGYLWRESPYQFCRNWPGVSPSRWRKRLIK